MLLTRLYLRNFRVYEDELDLALPPGLVGIYGPNGSGKSTLLEAILFTLWGRARTAKEEIRSAGVGGDCVTEVEFEHEGHLYVVRRSLSGINSTPKASVTCDGLQMTEGVRDVGRYVHSLLGMDDAAFRASVFAEQKQLAAFSGQTPAERRKLVLQLLGITPLDTARDEARRDARVTRERHDHLRSVLPDVAALRVAADDADAAAGAAEAIAGEAAEEERTASTRASEAQERLGRLDLLRQAYDGLVIEGRAARAELDRAQEAVAARERELDELDRAAAGLAAAERDAHGLAGDEAALGPLRALAEAAAAAADLTVPDPPPEPDPTERDRGAAAAETARARLAEVDGAHRAVTAELERARQAASRSSELSGEADCPLCGQALGEAWEQVRDHRAAEVAEAAARLEALSAQRTQAAAAAAAAVAALNAALDAYRAAEAARAAWDQARLRHDDAVAAEGRARSALAAVDPALVGPGGPAAPGTPPDALRAAVAAVEARAASKRRAAVTAERLRGRLEGRPALEAALARERDAAAGAEGEVTALRDKVKTLGFDPKELQEARQLAADATGAAQAHGRQAEEARLRAATARAAADGAQTRVNDAVAQHATLQELATDSQHLSRLADLLSEFRNTVVASVGPRLALQAAELFAELTDHEYDELQVDPDTYGLQISDGGRVYGLDRFSGSEIDLANLALRVAISEHIRFQSGGSVGLLVLDEVFGPLDEERKERMLGALERLRGRFRQVLVVTHDGSIKEQLPNAIEVVKLPGRRATARVLAA
ncbi:SMC family ATPase [Acidiferrimicrobium sp. IK]|uniref:SMC family ATPase n=1 Tax=Acidiferrimicrobium sp. IK TaxID=2871700 RepID=UPI0021CB7C43|nr:SMC family ATPase [Acidiferrimicrobium sp. IK]MCU4184063.1 SMC family ATPase [Acidiferrimicrobium sp. IK]